MVRSNKIVSAVVLVCFLLNTAVSDFAFGQSLNIHTSTDKLAPPNKFDDITGGVGTELARVEFLLTLQLKEVAGNLEILKYGENSYSDYVTYRHEFGGKHSLDTPFKDRVHFLFDDTLQHLTDKFLLYFALPWQRSRRQIPQLHHDQLALLSKDAKRVFQTNP